MISDTTKEPINSFNAIGQLTNRIICGAKPKYDEPVHVNLLLMLFTDGKDIAAFCASADVCRDTFHNWRKSHRAFRLAYQIALEKARAWWEYEYPLLDNFNPTYWSMVMRNRFGYTEHRRVKIPGLKKGQNFMQQYQCVMSMLAKGETTAAEAGQLSKIITSGIQIEEFTQTKKQVEFLMGEFEKQGARE